MDLWIYGWLLRSEGTESAVGPAINKQDTQNAANLDPVRHVKSEDHPGVILCYEMIMILY